MTTTLGEATGTGGGWVGLASEECLLEDACHHCRMLVYPGQSLVHPAFSSACRVVDSPTSSTATSPYAAAQWYGVWYCTAAWNSPGTCASTRQGRSIR